MIETIEEICESLRHSLDDETCEWYERRTDDERQWYSDLADRIEAADKRAGTTWNAIIRAYDHAVEKHPVFVNIPINIPRLYAGLESMRKRWNEVDERRKTIGVDSVLLEECYEALSALEARRYADARAEFAQVAAVAARAMEYCDAMIGDSE